MIHEAALGLGLEYAVREEAATVLLANPLFLLLLIHEGDMLNINNKSYKGKYVNDETGLT